MKKPITKNTNMKTQTIPVKNTSLTNHGETPGVLIFKHIVDEIEKLSKKNQLLVYQSITGYAFNHRVPVDLPAIVMLIFNLYRPTLDLCMKKYQSKVNRMTKAETELNNPVVEEKPVQEPVFSEQDFRDIEAEMTIIEPIIEQPENSITPPNTNNTKKTEGNNDWKEDGDDWEE